MYSNKSTIQNNKLQKVELTNTEEVQGNEDNVPIPELNTPKPKVKIKMYHYLYFCQSLVDYFV